MGANPSRTAPIFAVIRAKKGQLFDKKHHYFYVDICKALMDNVHLTRPERSALAG